MSFKEKIEKPLDAFLISIYSNLQYWYETTVPEK